ncbi:MAG: bacillithiol system redox-active protein YtxJ [Balneolaceae bacterium]
MGILDSLKSFTQMGGQYHSLWNLPQSTREIDALFSDTENAHAIYKHSNRCGISFIAQNSLESGIDKLQDTLRFHLIDVVTNRSLSAYISEKTGIRHESPQLILLYHGEVYWYASHGRVRIDALKDAAGELT